MNAQPSSVCETPSARAGNPLARAGRAWARFWFTPADPVALHAVRVLAGVLFLAWLLPLAGQRDALFGLGGWFDRQAYREAARLPGGPPVPVGWSALYLCGSDPARLSVAYWLSVGVLALFTAGLWTRLTAVLAWVVVASFIANPAVRSDADPLLAVLAFYLMVGYVLWGWWDGRRSLLSRLPGGDARPSYAANLAVRLIQVHFALAVVVSGLHKLQFGDWWAGVAFWYPLHPPMETTAESLRAYAGGMTGYLVWLSLAQYAVLAWQLLFPLFAWRRAWRPVLLGGALVGWAGSVFLYRQPLLGPVFCVACLSYLTPAEWRWVADRLPRWRRPVGEPRRAVAGPHRPVKVGVRA